MHNMRTYSTQLRATFAKLNPDCGSHRATFILWMSLAVRGSGKPTESFRDDQLSEASGTECCNLTARLSTPMDGRRGTAYFE